MATSTIKIDIPEQGISARLSKDEAQKFFKTELEFYQRMQKVLNENLLFGNSGLGQQSGLYRGATQLIQSALSAVTKDETEGLKSYIETTRAFKHIIGQGTIGQRVELLFSDGRHHQARWLLVLFSERDDDNPWIEPFRALALGNPAVLAFSDIAAAGQARKLSGEALERSESAEERLSKFVTEKTELFEQLEDLYRKKLVVEEPAISWEKIAGNKRRAWHLWLWIFAGLVVGPICTVIFWWEAFSRAVSHLATTGTGTISLSGVAAISVPALLYAWLLKNVSRVFIQNLNLADDAAHRRALAVTYLGLVENPKIELLEAERAIVLNALFRPVPPHGSDEGPPIGLIDLIRNKSS